MSEEEQDNLESENQEQEAGDSQETEQGSEETSSEDSDKVEKELYENQKTRAEKAEAKLKEMKEQLSEGDEQSSESSDDSQKSQSLEGNQMSAEELRLIARAGYDDDELDKLRKVAQVEETSLAEAEKSDIFSSWYQKRQQEQKSEQAQMGGSTGSGRQTKEKDVSDPGLSEDEHRKLWEQAMK